MNTQWQAVDEARQIAAAAVHVARPHSCEARKNSLLPGSVQSIKRDGRLLHQHQFAVAGSDISDAGCTGHAWRALYSELAFKLLADAVCFERFVYFDCLLCS